MPFIYFFFSVQLFPDRFFFIFINIFFRFFHYFSQPNSLLSLSILLFLHIFLSSFFQIYLTSILASFNHFPFFPDFSSYLFFFLLHLHTSCASHLLPPNTAFLLIDRSFVRLFVHSFLPSFLPSFLIISFILPLFLFIVAHPLFYFLYLFFFVVSFYLHHSHRFALMNFYYVLIFFLSPSFPSFISIFFPSLLLFYLPSLFCTSIRLHFCTKFFFIHSSSFILSSCFHLSFHRSTLLSFPLISLSYYSLHTL
ncbi:unnamed protein product [Acanthosepion pharaonis]|uniref:Uncharacterized protein n=1 Tax=Acanthosepion pharaonis TaxID=158019 RepID=A0A812DL84_ACAPH|nr:unnamed protein product [Sepia pharaonis]